VSIDREINSRVDAFGSNPQALKDRYSMTKELVDLLALQRIKKGMDEQRNSIAMMMNTNPATIKQQREQEIFGRTAQDVAQQVGGVLQTAQNQKQMAQRRPAPQGLGALMPQQGQRPQQPQTRMMQAGGIVAFQEGNKVSAPTALGDLPDKGVTQEQLRDVARAQIQQLLEGGMSPQAIKQELPPQYLELVDEIVQTRRATAPPGMMEEVVVTGQREPSPLSAEGMMREQAKTKQTKDKNITQIPVPKDITPSTLSKVIEGLGAIGEGFGERTGESIEEASGIRKRMREALTPESVLEAQRTGKYRYRTSPQTETPQTKPPTQDQTEGIAAVAEQPKGVPSDTPLIFRGQQNVPAGTAPSGTAGTAPPSKPQGFDLKTALSEVEPLEYTPVDRTSADATGIERLKKFGMDPATMEMDPTKTGQAAYAEAAQQLGIKDKDAERRAGLQELADIDAAQTDPDRLRQDRLIAFLLGGANRGSSALAASGAASANLGRAQDRSIRARQIKRNEMVAEIQNANTTLIQSAQARGDTATARQANMINNAMQTLATYETAEIKARSADATNKMSTQIANYERKISEIGMFAEQAQNKIQARIDRGDTLRDVQNDARDSLEKISEQFNELQNEAVRTDPAVQLLNRKIAEAIDDDDVDEANRLRAQIPREVARIQEEFIIANSQLYDTYKSLTDTVNSLGSQIQSTVMGDSGISNQQVDDIVKRQLQKGTPEYLQPYNP
jgi:hypothetical protein